MVKNFHSPHCNHSYTANANHSFGVACNHLHMKINSLFEQIRLSANDNQDNAARKAGISRIAYRKWENGQTTDYRRENLLRFCDAYRIDVEHLLRGRIVYVDSGSVRESGHGAREPRLEYNADKMFAQDDQEREILIAWRNRTPDQEAMFLALVSMAKTEKQSAHDPSIDKLAS